MTEDRIDLPDCFDTVAEVIDDAGYVTSFKSEDTAA